MRATLPYVQHKFDEFNRLCFDGKLPAIPVQLTNARTYVGQVVGKRFKQPDGSWRMGAFVMRISVRHDLSEQELEDTILHEMIHYYLGVNQMVDTAPHGELFVNMMNRINEQYGRHITISHRSTPEQRAASVDTRRLWHVIAAVAFSDGTAGVKVLPRIVQRITTYYNWVTGVDIVQSVKLYLSNNPYFNRYPNSGAFKVYSIDEATLKRELEGADIVECDGYTVTTHPAPKTI